MNSKEQIVTRFLKLFPIENIKEYFGIRVTKKSELLPAVVNSNPNLNLAEFVQENFNYTKQHIYMFSCDVPDFSVLPGQLLSCPTTKMVNDEYVEYFSIFNVTYHVYFMEPEKRPLDLIFRWPIHIVINHSLIVVYFTILEKNIQSYFSDATVLTTRKAVDEKELLGLIANGLQSFGVPISHDLNKGIKELWNRDIIDAIDVQYRKAKSISKETMDEDYTFKHQYPQQYQEAIRSPLGRTSFKFITNHGEYCDHFTIDPTNGEITFPIFSKSKEQTQNVIRKILELN
jgi:hypothetical protein